MQVWQLSVPLQVPAIRERGSKFHPKIEQRENIECREQDQIWMMSLK